MNRRTYPMRFAIAVLLTALSSTCFACYSPPTLQHVAPDELISRTTTIALAKVLRAEVAKDGFSVIYTFQTTRPLKGTPQKQFQVQGYPAVEGEDRQFNDHVDSTFWTNFGGRIHNDTDCQIHPSFSVGGTYLIFLDQPYHVKSFEIIMRAQGNADTKDKWLQFVESRIGASKSSNRSRVSNAKRQA